MWSMSLAWMAFAVVADTGAQCTCDRARRSPPGIDTVSIVCELLQVRLLRERAFLEHWLWLATRENRLQHRPWILHQGTVRRASHSQSLTLWPRYLRLSEENELHHRCAVGWRMLVVSDWIFVGSLLGLMKRLFLTERL